MREADDPLGGASIGADALRFLGALLRPGPFVAHNLRGQARQDAGPERRAGASCSIQLKVIL